MLFVLGQKSGWAEKAVAVGADAVILDLEDSVPAADKAEARKTVRETIWRLREQGVRSDVWVRPNSYDSGCSALTSRRWPSPAWRVCSCRRCSTPKRSCGSTRSCRTSRPGRVLRRGRSG